MYIIWPASTYADNRIIPFYVTSVRTILVFANKLTHRCFTGVCFFFFFFYQAELLWSELLWLEMIHTHFFFELAVLHIV